MGIFDFLTSEIHCPSCGRAGARRLLWMVRCGNRNCERYDPATELRHHEGDNPYAPPAPSRTRATATPAIPAVPTPPTGAFDPGPHAIELLYTNFRGERKTFVGDRRTLRRSSHHVSVRVGPTGRRITLAAGRLDNPSSELEPPPAPDATERQILGYHLKYGTTSSRFEEIRRRFPDWQPQ